MAVSQTARVSVWLRPVASAPASARQLVVRSALSWGLPARLVDDAALVAGALVLESVRQARSPLRLTVHSGDLAVMVEVEDACVLFPMAAGLSGTGRGRYGLELVHRVAEAFGFVRRPGGRRLWARIVDVSASMTARTSADAVSGHLTGLGAS